MATIGTLTAGNDNITGTGANEEVIVPSSNSNLSGADIIDGGTGTDTLEFLRTSALSVSYLKLAGLSGIEQFDVTASSSVLLSFNDAALQQSDTQSIRILFDSDPLSLDLREVTPGAGSVVLAGSGTVTLYDAVQQTVTVADGFDTTVIGGDNRDTLIGGSGANTFTGGAGDDILIGNGAADVLSGGDGNDHLSGGGGNDTLTGGAGYDLIESGGGRNTATGGDGSDTFVLSGNSVLTITDFNTSDAYERIDVRSFAGLTFADLAINESSSNTLVTVGTSTVVLTGLTAADVTPEMFIFDGDPVVALAAGLGQVPFFEFTANADSATGTAADEVFEVKGSFAKLSADDTFDGGTGTDTLRIWGDDRSLAPSRITGMDGIEVIDLTGATGALGVAVDAAMVAQSDTGTITVKHGPSTLALDTELVASAADVIVEGTGAVTLRDVAGQVVTVSDSIAGTVTGQNKDDTIIGGALGDTLSGSGGDDVLSGKRGNDTLSGGDGYDILTGGSGRNTVSGGADTDRFIVTPGETLIIQDFDITDVFEQIDITAIAGVSFGDFTIIANGGNAQITIPSGTVVTLNGVSSSDVTEELFIFEGNPVPQVLRLTDGADTLNGSDAADVFDLIGGDAQLDASIDTLNGGQGIDVLRAFGSTRVLGEARLDALNGIEIIDLTQSTGPHDVALTDAITATSDTGVITIRHGSHDLALNTSLVSNAAQVIVEGSGQVTLSDVPGQVVTISNVVGGDVIGGNDANTILGGDKADTIAGREGFDEISGGKGNDTLIGGQGDDVVFGGGGADTLSGGADNDRLFGESGADTLSGGSGYDLLSGGGGTNTATGGTGADAFVVSTGETLTITDFDTTDAYERIDLRAFSGLTFASLTIAKNGGNAQITLPGGASVTLTGVAAADLTADMFVFRGDPVVLLGDGLSARFDFQFTDQVDDFTGNNSDEIFDLSGLLSNLEGTDTFDGGGGTDTLRIFGDDRSISPDRLAGMDGIEVLDLSGAVSASVPLSVTVNDAMVNQSDTGVFTVRHGANELFLDTSEVSDISDIIIEGTGLVTLRNVPDQTVTISDLIGGNVVDGNDGNTIQGGAKADMINGMERPDTIRGGGGDDTLLGGEGDDVVSGGAGNDTISGGIGRDRLIADGGADVISGNEGSDLFVIKGGAQGTVLADYEAANFVERIDLSALSNLTEFSDLTITNEGSDVRVTGTGLDLLIKDTQANELDDTDFLFKGQDPLLYTVKSGTTNAQLQQLFDGALPGAIIKIAAGTYSITETLTISRGDITVTGAGEGKTIFRTDIAAENAGQTIVVQPDDLMVRLGAIEADVAEGGKQFTVTADHELAVGDLLYVSQANDDAWLAEINSTEWIQPETTPETAEDFYLREFRSRIVEIDGNVITVADASPYAFEANVANAGQNTFLSNVHLSKFSINGSFGTPDPYHFEDTMPEWTSIAALELDGVENSSITDITINDPAAHAFKLQRAHDVTGDNLTADGAHNKSGSSGYHFLFQESFSNDLTNLTSIDARHAVLFSSYSAEHYNNIHMLYSNRDINFHGSPDDENTIVVDVLEQDYPTGVLPQWQAVHPGVTGLHPTSTIEANDVTFKYARSGERSDRIVAHEDGGNIATNEGSDEVIGGVGNDIVKGDGGNDTLFGNGGDDILNGDDGKDVIRGGAGNDILRGGDGNDKLFGGAGDDVINGGANGDDLTGGAGQDTFLRIYEDFTDNILDFEAGAGGDILRIRGSAYTKFSELLLRQEGNDTILEFGPTGSTTLKNINMNSLIAANFAFDGGSAPGQEIALKATQMQAVGTDKSDSFSAARAHIDNAGFTVLGGTGYDKITFASSSLNENLGETGTYTGIEEFDLSSIATLGLVVENPLVSQSNSSKLYLSIGESGTAVLLDVGPLGRGKNVYINGSREVRLTGDREHTVKSTDDFGVNILGDSQRDIIFGGRNDDTIDGGAGNDAIFGAGGDDILRGGLGNDIINGGPGSDTIYIENIGDKVAESRRWDGTDHVISEVDFLLGTAHVENLTLVGSDNIRGIGNGLMNTITGNSGNNILDGGKNVDTLIGGAGNDTYFLRAPGDNAVEEVNGGIDTVKAFRTIALDDNVENLYIQTLRNAAGDGITGVNGIGNELNNVIVGNPFGNAISGKEGNDTLRGQAGADVFIFDTALNEATNVDRILDFASGEDEIKLKNTVFTGIAKGDLAADAFALGTAAQDANDRIIYDQSSGKLWFDSDGSGAADQIHFATLTTAPIISEDDFVII